jgi:hypothetical protein
MSEQIGSSQPKYDVALSFAGEDRDYVEQVAEALKGRLRVFYDKYEAVELWGKDLGDHLDYVYRQASRYCVIFASVHYERKVWTNHERKSAQSQAIQANEEYVLPVRLDDTEIPGIRPTVGYIDAGAVTPGELADMIVTKVGPSTPLAETEPATQIIALSGTDPQAALDKLFEQIELELRHLLAQTGWANGGFGGTVADGAAWLADNGTLGRGTAASFGRLIQQREQLVDGGTLNDDAARREIDEGLGLLKTLQVIPREVNVVDHPGVDIFEDEECQHKHPGMGLILQTISPGATATTRRIYPTTRRYERGKVVTWEWNDRRRWDAAWYRDPETGAVEYAWLGALEFAGRNLEEIVAIGDWSSPDGLVAR